MMLSYIRYELLTLLIGLIATSGFQVVAQETVSSSLTPHEPQVSSIVWSPDSKFIAAGNWNGQISITNASGQRLYTLNGHTNRVSDLAWNGDSTQLATVSGDGTLKLWDAVNGTLIRTTLISNEYATAVIWTQDNHEIITASSVENSKLSIWDANTGDLIQSFDSGTIVQMRWSLDYRQLAVANPGGIGFRDGKTLEHIQFLENPELGGQGYDDYTLAWSSDSSQITSGKLNGMLRTWNVAQGEIVSTLAASKLEELAFTNSLITALIYINQDNELISVRADGMVYRLSARTGRVVAQAHLNGSAYAAAFSPNNSYLAYGSDGTEIQILSLSDLFTPPTAAPA